MKYLTLILFTITLNLISNTLIAQDSKAKKYSIQLDYGISKTLHYNEPVDRRSPADVCYEGCLPPEQQLSKQAFNLSLSIYRNINEKNSINIGGGFSEYRFLEKERHDHLGLPPYLLEKTLEFKYFNFSTGFRHVFNNKKLVNPFVEATLIYEILREGNDFLKNSGIAIKPNAGIIIKLSDRWSGVFQAFFKTGIIKYNERKINEDYIPYGYGLQLGLNYKI